MGKKLRHFTWGLWLVAIHLLLIGVAFFAAHEGTQSGNVDSNLGTATSFIIFGFVDYPLLGVFESLRPHIATSGDRMFAAFVLFGGLGSVKWFVIGAMLQSLFRWLSGEIGRPNHPPVRTPDSGPKTESASQSGAAHL